VISRKEGRKEGKDQVNVEAFSLENSHDALAFALLFPSILRGWVDVEVGWEGRK
jgi:hypothetical protein